MIGKCFENALPRKRQIMVSRSIISLRKKSPKDTFDIQSKNQNDAGEAVHGKRDEDDLLQNLILSGNNCFEKDKYGKAFSNYLRAIKLLLPMVTAENPLIANLSFSHDLKFVGVMEAKQMFHAAKLLVNIGAVLIKIGNFSRAMEALESSLKLSLCLLEKFGSPHQILKSGKRVFRNTDDDMIQVQCLNLTADCLRNKSVLHMRRIDYLNAYEMLQMCSSYRRSALKMAQAISTNDEPLTRSCRHSLADTLQAYGWICSQRGLFDESKLAYCEGINLSYDREQKEMIPFITALSEIYTYCNEFQDAYSSYMVLIEMMKREQDTAGLIEVSLKLTSLHQRQTNYANALQQAKCTVASAAELNCTDSLHKTTLQSKAMSKLGSIYESMGNFNQAKKWYKKALDESLKGLPLEHPLVVESIISIASLYYKRSGCDRAIKIYTKCLGKYFLALGEKHRICAIITDKLGEAYSELGDFDRAIEMHEEARKRMSMILRGRQSHPDMAVILRNTAVTYGKAGRMDECIDLFSEALCILDTCGLTHGHPTVLETMQLIDRYFVQ
jgi:tetratricopeptide (TPR) repeat protein